MSEIKHVSSDDFEPSVLESGKPVLVDFWAEWCGPCKQIAPVLEQLAVDYDARIQIVKVDVDANRQLAAKYGIRSIPTLLMFNSGEQVASQIGAVGRANLEEMIEEVLKGADE